MGCSSSRDARGAAVSPPPPSAAPPSLRSRSLAVLTSLGLCRAGHDAAVHAYAPLPCEEAPPAGKVAADEAPPALDFDLATLPEQKNPPPPEKKPAIRDMPEVTAGIVRARVNEFHLKMLKKKKAAAAAAAAEEEEEAPGFFFFFGDGNDVTAAPKLRPPPRAGKKTVVLYFTSLRGVRRTFEDCGAVRTILQCYHVRLDERDVSMHAAFKSELRDLLGNGGGGPALPRVFVGGGDLGGAEELRAMHEAGELAVALAGCAVDDGAAAAGCAACGEAGFVVCGTCRGSCKVFVDGEGCRRFAGFFRQCLDCNENGLIRCPVCVVTD